MVKSKPQQQKARKRRSTEEGLDEFVELDNGSPLSPPPEQERPLASESNEEESQGTDSTSDDYGTPIRSRQRFTPDETRQLEEVYKKSTRPSSDAKQRLAMKFDTTTQRIQIWFQNRRAKEKKTGQNTGSGEPDCPVSNRVKREDGEPTGSSRTFPPSLGFIQEQQRRQQRAKERKKMESQHQKKRRRSSQQQQQQDDDNDEPASAAVQLRSPTLGYPSYVEAGSQSPPPTPPFYHGESADDSQYNPMSDYSLSPTMRQINPATAFGQISYRGRDGKLRYPTVPSTVDPTAVVFTAPTYGGAHPYYPEQFVHPHQFVAGQQQPGMESMMKHDTSLTTGDDDYLGLLAEASTSHQQLTTPPEEPTTRGTSTNILAHEVGPPAIKEESPSFEEDLPKKGELLILSNIGHN